MKYFLLTTMFFFFIHLSAQQWELVWEDNFDSLNTDIWLVQNHFDHYGGELQVYTSRSENVFVEDGNLILRVLREEYTCPPEALNPWACARQYNTGQPYQYTSGWVETQPAYNTEYGYIEARINLPWGRGFWPAFWTFVGEGLESHENAAEIDIFEMYGHKPSTLLSTNVHLQYCNENYPTYPDCSDIPKYGKEHIIPSYANKYHVYAIEWTPTILKWRFNGTAIRVMSNPGVVDPVRTIINMALLQGNPPTVNTPFPSDIKVDYVRVYRQVVVADVHESKISSQDLQTFPNPAQNTLHINFTSPKNLFIEDLTITDLLGRTLLYITGLNEQEYQFDISGLPKSHYQVRVKTNEGMVTKGFVKM
jgi:beta-glucanase (GH16 family)